MPAPSAIRFLGTLEDLGYVSRDPLTKAYHLSTKFAYLGNRAQEQNSMLSIVHPILQRLSAEIAECTCLGAEQNGAVVYLDMVRSEDTDSNHITRYIGNWAPMYCTGIGKVLLSDYDEAALQGYLNRTELTRYTPLTIVSADVLRKELTSIRDLGYAIDDEECENGKVCVAAPVRNFSNRVVAALSITGSKDRMNQRMKRLIPKVTEAARLASQRMGYNQ